MKLYNTLNNLILEVASRDQIIDAIKNRRVCAIYYDGDEPGGRGIREVEPVALGKSKAGNLVMRGWDREGASHTGYKGEQPLPGWRLFRLDKILSLKPTGEVYNQPHPGYNFNGDKSMVSIITIAKFDNNPTEPVTPEQQTV
jgi:predicted DNA-binding transcriptional regulator YafY